VSKVRVQLKLKGLNALMTSAPVQAEVDRVGRRIARSAGDGFAYSEAKPHKWTARGFVQTNSPEGARRQAEDAVLERAMSGAKQ